MTLIRTATRGRIFVLGLILAPLLFGALPNASAKGKKPRPTSRTERLSAYFHRSIDELDSLRDKGYGYGEMVKILVVAEMSREPIDKLVARNRKGFGWGSISRQLGLDVVYVRKRVDEARTDLRIHTHPTPAAPEPPRPAPKQAPKS